MRPIGLNQAAKATFLKTTTDTNASGTYVRVGVTTGAAVDCREIEVRNDTGATLNFARSNDGATVVGDIFPIPTATAFTFKGLRSSQNLIVLPASGGAVTFYAEARDC